LQVRNKKLVGIIDKDGKNIFQAPVTQSVPKLYVISRDFKIIYVGVTNQPTRNRLRIGFNPDTRTGYRVYKWVRKSGKYELVIWIAGGTPIKENQRAS
jgi:hypothetical protein